MKIVLFSHPEFMASQSMPRFAGMLRDAYIARGYQVKVWRPVAKVSNWVYKGGLKKWAGYIDQYILFPMTVKRLLRQQPADTLYVFCDQALGPWVPLVKSRPHVVHAHDLLALRSALGLIPENPTSWTGRLYQKYIRSGFSQASNFISISKNTRSDLHEFGRVRPEISEVVYNGLNYPFAPMPADKAHALIAAAGLPVDDRRMLLHISGAQWYKNMPGLLHMYIAYAKRVAEPLPLWCIGPPPGNALREILRDLPSNGRVLFFQKLDQQVLVAAYSIAEAFIFPSLVEGFGWPIIEAQACGCLVMTTDAAPMSEISGPAASLIPRLLSSDDIKVWAESAASGLLDLLSLPPELKKMRVSQGLAHARKFDADLAIDAYLSIYEKVLRQH
jgi:glycosyltransferase involved in cell wall biosynthesis